MKQIPIYVAGILLSLLMTGRTLRPAPIFLKYPEPDTPKSRSVQTQENLEELSQKLDSGDKRVNQLKKETEKAKNTTNATEKESKKLLVEIAKQQKEADTVVKVIRDTVFVPKNSPKLQNGNHNNPPDKITPKRKTWFGQLFQTIRGGKLFKGKQ